MVVVNGLFDGLELFAGSKLEARVTTMLWVGRAFIDMELLSALTDVVPVLYIAQSASLFSDITQLRRSSGEQTI